MTRTLLIGLDGATFSVLDHLVDLGLMPNLKEVLAGGVRARLRSTPNPLTPPAWTSVVTGRGPGNHGIFDFVRVEDFADGPRYRLATSSDVQCETIWSMLSREGKRVLALNFPVMFPARPVNGCTIAGFTPLRHLRAGVYPSGLVERLMHMPRLDVRGLTVDFEHERKSVQVLAPADHEGWVRQHIWREQQWLTVMRQLLQEEPWDLAGIIFDGVDKLQHACWRFIDPELSATLRTPWEQTIRQLCLDYFRMLDDALGELMLEVGPQAHVYLASDHGFTTTRHVFYVNVWLRQRGMLEWQADVPFGPDGMLNTEGMKTAGFLFDWPKTTAYALTAGSNGIRFRSGGNTLVDERALREDMADELMRVQHPATGEPVVAGVLRREDAFPGKCTQLAPDLTLVLRDHGFASVLNAPSVVRERSEVAGTHHPEGVFMAIGSGIRRGVDLGELSILDVAPALLHSAGVAIPDEFEGCLPARLFEAPERRAAPLPVASDLERFALGQDQLTMDSEGEALVFKRLQALGYIE